MLPNKMILKKIPQQLTEKAWKFLLALILLITWGTIILGTYLLLS